jgi:hypothetical protein
MNRQASHRPWNEAVAGPTPHSPTTFSDPHTTEMLAVGTGPLAACSPVTLGIPIGGSVSLSCQSLEFTVMVLGPPLKVAVSEAMN